MINIPDIEEIKALLEEVQLTEADKKRIAEYRAIYRPGCGLPPIRVSCRARQIVVMKYLQELYEKGAPGKYVPVKIEETE